MNGLRVSSNDPWPMDWRVKSVARCYWSRPSSLESDWSNPSCLLFSDWSIAFCPPPPQKPTTRTSIIWWSDVLSRSVSGDCNRWKSTNGADSAWMIWNQVHLICKVISGISTLTMLTRTLHAYLFSSSATFAFLSSEFCGQYFLLFVTVLTRWYSIPSLPFSPQTDGRAGKKVNVKDCPFQQSCKLKLLLHIIDCVLVKMETYFFLLSSLFCLMTNSPLLSTATATAAAVALVSNELCSRCLLPFYRVDEKNVLFIRKCQHRSAVLSLPRPQTP